MITELLTDIREMIGRSRYVLTERSIAAFEECRPFANTRSALTYTVFCSLLISLIGFTEGFGGFALLFVRTIFDFLVFVGLTYFIGRRLGGVGGFVEILYIFSLFWIPLNVVIGFAVAALFAFILAISLALGLVIPLLGILTLLISAFFFVAFAFFVFCVSPIAQIYFSYLVLQASMGIQGFGKATLILLFPTIVNITLLFVPFLSYSTTLK
jgi:hypothetical protein